MIGYEPSNIGVDQLSGSINSAAAIGSSINNDMNENSILDMFDKMPPMLRNNMYFLLGNGPIQSWCVKGTENGKTFLGITVDDNWGYSQDEMVYKRQSPSRIRRDAKRKERFGDPSNFHTDKTRGDRSLKCPLTPPETPASPVKYFLNHK